MTEQFESFFPPPWPLVEANEDKTYGWIEFQRQVRKSPDYYLHPEFGLLAKYNSIIKDLKYDPNSKSLSS